MSARILQFFFRSDVQQDWNQQELAEFYRVETVLIQSGISLETDRGISDEGDPWFIFCRPQTGDVVVHFARHGNEYIAAGGALDHVLRGRSFRDIIDAFMSRQPMVVSGGKSPETSVYLHPAALLSAFVATAFFLFTSSEAQAASADQEGKDAAIAASAGQTRMPAAFQTMIEAAGLAGNRDAWTALSTVAIAFLAGLADIKNEDETSKTQNVLLQPIDSGDASVELPPRQQEGGAEPQPLIKSASIDIDAKNETLVAGEEVESPDASSIIRTFESGAAAPRLKTIDPFANQGTSAQADAGAWMSVETGVLQARSLDDSLGLADFSETPERVTEKIVLQAGDVASSASLLVFESLEFAPQAPASDFFSKNFINAIEATHRAEGRSSDYMNAEIHYAGAAISFGDSRTGDKNQISAVVEADSRSYVNVQASAIQALEWFAQTYPNYKVVSLGPNIVMFDWSTINEVQASIELHSWIMDDGSTINIIGSLPDIFSTIA